MPRAIWSGSIVFGLVNVPVRIFSAVSEHKLHFNLVHEPDGSPIGYQKICKAEDKPVPGRRDRQGVRVREGRVGLHGRRGLPGRARRGLQARSTSPTSSPTTEIDPIYFAKTYYVGPQDGAERVYALLVQAMEQSSLAGIAKFVMRDRQYLGALRVREGVITLEQLYFADEIRDRSTRSSPRSARSRSASSRWPRS